MAAHTLTAPLLAVDDIVIRFAGPRGQAPVRAVDGVSFDVEQGECVGLVGESGCGKSVTALSLLRLLPSPPAELSSGSVRLHGRDLWQLPEREMRKVRGRDIAMVFQEPMTSLNPVYTVGAQIIEAIRLHEPIGREPARRRAAELLQQVGIPSPETNLDAYPHQLSGGMRQRVMIAMALSCRPKLLLADEPTTALDVTIQAQILELLDSLRRERGLGVVLITHDLAVVAQYTRRVVVMYAGRVVERGPTAAVFERPLHPYTRGLLRSLPGRTKVAHRGKLPTIEGMVPELRHLPPGCAFAARCEFVQPACREHVPELERRGEREVRCRRADELQTLDPWPSGDAA